MLDWNDLRYFLAVAETGSTRAAGQALRVSQTTAARRIAALEEELGLTLFERRQSGYTLTPVGETLLDRARQVSDAAADFVDAAASEGREVSGTVRLTTGDIYAMTVLAPILRRLHESYPAIRIEVDTSEDVLDLAAGAADVALRSSKAMPDGAGLVGRRIADDPWTLYCSRAYAEEKGIPRSRAELLRHDFVGGGGAKAWPHYREWLQKHDLEGRVSMHHGSATGMLSAVRAGYGLAVLPMFVAEREADLVRCLPPRNDDMAGIWLMTHERLRHAPRVRAVLDFLARELKDATREIARAA
jgi:DNA-binding transcriptional LysR family regulator